MIALVILRHGLDDLARFLAAGRRVQEDEALAGVYFLIEDREIRQDGFDVEGGLGHCHASAAFCLITAGCCRMVTG